MSSYFQEAKANTQSALRQGETAFEKGINKVESAFGQAEARVNQFFTAPLPAYADISKAANDLLNKDFYHVAAGMLRDRASERSALI